MSKRPRAVEDEDDEDEPLRQIMRRPDDALAPLADYLNDQPPTTAVSSDLGLLPEHLVTVLENLPVVAQRGEHPVFSGDGNRVEETGSLMSMEQTHRFYHTPHGARVLGLAWKWHNFHDYRRPFPPHRPYRIVSNFELLANEHRLADTLDTACSVWDKAIKHGVANPIHLLWGGLSGRHIDLVLEELAERGAGLYFSPVELQSLGKAYRYANYWKDAWFRTRQALVLRMSLVRGSALYWDRVPSADPGHASSSVDQLIYLFNSKTADDQGSASHSPVANDEARLVNLATWAGRGPPRYVRFMKIDHLREISKSADPGLFDEADRLLRLAHSEPAPPYARIVDDDVVERGWYAGEDMVLWYRDVHTHRVLVDGDLAWRGSYRAHNTVLLHAPTGEICLELRPRPHPGTYTKVERYTTALYHRADKGEIDLAHVDLDVFEPSFYKAHAKANLGYQGNLLSLIMQAAHASLDGTRGRIDLLYGMYHRDWPADSANGIDANMIGSDEVGIGLYMLVQFATMDYTTEFKALKLRKDTDPTYTWLGAVQQLSMIDWMARGVIQHETRDRGLAAGYVLFKCHHLEAAQTMISSSSTIRPLDATLHMTCEQCAQ